MTISDAAIKFRYEGNASTDTFAFSAKAFTAADLVVEIITRATDALEETLTLTTHYAVTIAVDGTASIETVAGKIPSATQDIQIRRALAQTQTVVLPTGSKFPAKSVETAIDRAVGLSQDIDEAVNRSLKFPATSSTTASTLPEPTDDAVLVFDGVTGLFKVGATNTDLVAGAAAAGVSAAAALSSENAASSSAAAAVVSASAASTSADEAAASAAGVNLPEAGSGDATKLLKVNAGETGYELGAKLPDFTSSKQGALAIQNAADDGFGFLTTQGTAGDPLLSGGADADPAFTAIATFAASVAALNYPVGSLYFNVTNSTNPATLLGFGTWSAITDKFIIGASGTYSAGSTGGAATHTLTAAEIPDLTYAIATNTGGASGGSAARLGDTGTTATTADGSATSAITTNAGGGAHSILNPYLAAYVWQRTA